MDRHGIAVLIVVDDSERDFSAFAIARTGVLASMHLSRSTVSNPFSSRFARVPRPLGAAGGATLRQSTTSCAR